LGCDINQTQRHDKDTALHYAYFQNNEEIISRLIKAGAKVDALNIYGKTAINYLEVVV
jgi:ankyrin repeat protein